MLLVAAPFREVAQLPLAGPRLNTHVARQMEQTRKSLISHKPQILTREYRDFNYMRFG
jgi:hypothetical protein